MRPGKYRKNIEKKTGNSRLHFLLGLVLFLSSLLLARLFYLQAYRTEHYRQLAQSQHQMNRELEPRRGRILIQDSPEYDEQKLYPIATTREFADIYAVPQKVQDPAATAAKLYDIHDAENDRRHFEAVYKRSIKEIDEEASSTPLEKEDKRQIALEEKDAAIEKAKTEKIASYLAKLDKPNDPYESLWRKISDKELAAIEAAALPGIATSMTPYRFYPERTIGAQLVGFVGWDQEGHQDGQYGLEGFFDAQLRGEAGVLRAERAANRQIIIVSDREEKKAKDGDDLVLTIVRPIQYEVCRRLAEATERHGASLGSVIAMDPKTGAIMAMCSYPDYDPNEYGQVEDRRVFNNPAIFADYEPGSTFKVITMAASLDGGGVTPDTTYEDKGFLMIDGWPKPIKNSDYETHGGHGRVDMGTVLDYSLNTGAIFAMRQIGEDSFAQYVKAFGFGEKVGIELETEAQTDINNLLKKKKRPVEVATASFGQGITVTPLQLLAAYGAIANGGILMKPYVVSRIIGADGNETITQPKQIRRVISERSAMQLAGMMVNVTERGHSPKAKIDGYYVAGKTGTAQLAENGRYGQWTIHSFCGFTPVDDPKVVMLVRFDKVRDVRFADSSAAPLFSELGKFILDYYNVPQEREVIKKGNQ